MARYLRQVLVSEVGEAGQLRIQASTPRVGGASLAHEVAALYAKGAGAHAVAPGTIDVADLAPETITTPAAREVLSGSRAALRELLAAVRSAEVSP